MRSLPLTGAMFLFLWLGACSFDTDETPPEVTTTEPAADATDVAQDAVITVTFSEALLGDTLTTESLVVTQGGEPVPGSLTYDDVNNALEFAPENFWTRTLEYTVTLDPAITDLASNRLGEYGFSFTVTDGEWGTAAMLSDGAGDASNPVIASAPDGTAIAAWLQNDGLYNIVYAAHYSPDFGGWGTSGPIDIYELGDAVSPQIATGANGDTFVIWAEDDGGAGTGNDSIWAIRYTASGGWEAPQLLEESASGADHADSPQIAVDGEGNAIAVWIQANDTAGGRTDVWYNIFSADTLTWEGAALLESDNAGDAGATSGGSPRVSMNANGDVVATWSQADGAGVISAYARRYMSDSGWQPVVEIDSNTDNSANASNVRIAINDGGNIIAAWTQWNAANSAAWLESRFYIEGGWSDPTTLSDTSDISGGNGTHVTLDAQMNAMAIWTDLEAASMMSDLSAARYTPDGGWSDPEPVENDAEQSSLFPSLTVDTFGNALAVWTLVDGAITETGSADVSIQAARHLAADGSWSAPELIEAVDTPASLSALTVGPQGDGIAVWAQTDEGGVSNIRTNIFQ